MSTHPSSVVSHRRLAARLAVVLLVAGACLLPAADSAPRVRYRIVDLGTLGGGSAEARDINNRGQVVGVAATANGEGHAFLWEAGRMTDLGTLGGPWSGAEAINDRGQVAGSSETAGGAQHAALWTNGRVRDLGTLGGRRATASDINNRGQVVGTSEIPETAEWGPLSRAFLWQAGQMRDLGTFGGPDSFAKAINDRGQIVGSADASDGSYKPVLWSGGRMQALPLHRFDRGGWASDITNRGRIVGTARSRWSDRSAVVWRRLGKQQHRGLDGPPEDSMAYAANERGQAVGRLGLVADNNERAVLWERGRYQVLPLLHRRGRAEALAISDRGQIVGWADDADRREHAVIWVPIHWWENR